MMNKACLVLIVALCPATLFAGETMVTRKTQTTRTTTTPCNFRVDKCQTSVATDPTLVHYIDGKPTLGGDVGSASSNAPVSVAYTFVDYAPSAPQMSAEQLVALIRNNLSNCPDVTVNYDADTGDITVHYLKSTCDCNCDWVVNVRNVGADDFVLKRTSDNYSPYLGQMERTKFHCTNAQDAQNIQSACAQICKTNNWTMYP